MRVKMAIGSIDFHFAAITYIYIYTCQVCIAAPTAAASVAAADQCRRRDSNK